MGNKPPRWSRFRKGPPNRGRNAHSKHTPSQTTGNRQQNPAYEVEFDLYSQGPVNELDVARTQWSLHEKQSGNPFPSVQWDHLPKPGPTYKRDPGGKHGTENHAGPIWRINSDRPRPEKRRTAGPRAVGCRTNAVAADDKEEDDPQSPICCKGQEPTPQCGTGNGRTGKVRAHDPQHRDTPQAIEKAIGTTCHETLLPERPHRSPLANARRSPVVLMPSIPTENSNSL